MKYTQFSQQLSSMPHSQSLLAFLLFFRLSLIFISFLWTEIVKTKHKILSEISLVQNNWFLYFNASLKELCLFFSWQHHELIICFSSNIHLKIISCFNRWMHCPFSFLSINAITSMKIILSLSESNLSSSSGILRTSLQSFTFLCHLHIL